MFKIDPAISAVDHRLDRVLHQKERGPHVEGHDPIEQLRRRGPKSCPRSEVAALLTRKSMRSNARRAVSVTRRQSSTTARSARTNSVSHPARTELAGEPFAVFGTSPANHESPDQSLIHQPASDGLPEPLSAAGHDRHFTFIVSVACHRSECLLTSEVCLQGTCRGCVGQADGSGTASTLSSARERGGLRRRRDRTSGGQNNLVVLAAKQEDAAHSANVLAGLARCWWKQFFFRLSSPFVRRWMRNHSSSTDTTRQCPEAQKIILLLQHALNACLSDNGAMDRAFFCAARSPSRDDPYHCGRRNRT